MYFNHIYTVTTTPFTSQIEASTYHLYCTYFRLTFDYLVISIDVVDSYIAQLQDKTDCVDQYDGGVGLDHTVGRPQRTAETKEERQRERL